jgi:hypothetical protein
MFYPSSRRDFDMATKQQKKRRNNPVTASLERLYKIVEDHLISLPGNEARERLKAIDAARSRRREQDSRIHASQSHTEDSPVLCRRQE